MQPALFYDDIYDAIRDVVQAAGGPKKVGLALWPDKSQQMAHTHLLNCMDRNRPEKFSPTQLMMLCKLGRQHDCHAMMAYINAETGYEPPKPLRPEDEREKLQRQVVAAADSLKESLARLERLTQTPVQLIGSRSNAREAGG